MKFAHILDAFYCRPWHILGEKHAAMSVALRAHINGDKMDGVQIHPRQSIFAADSARPIVGPLDDCGNPLVEQMQVARNVAVIPVHGVLGQKLSWLDLWCGGCDYAHIAEFIAQADADPAIDTVIFDFDSPGGMAAGCPETAEFFTSLSTRKMTVAFTQSQMCSAAYFLASQCREIYCTQTAQVGSIGTICAYVDESREWEIKGWKAEVFSTSEYKETGIPGKPFTDEQRAYIKERMLQVDANFKTAVTTARPDMTEEAISGKWFRGDALMGSTALNTGLVDGLAKSLDEVVFSLLT